MPLQNFQPSALRTHLRNVTMSMHKRVEAGVNLDGMSSLSAYRRILEQLLGLHLPLERGLGRLDLASLGLDYNSRRKVHWLEDDLIDLGHSRDSIAALPQPPGSPVPKTPYEGLGVLYVLEGASLGGQLIIRALGPKLDIAASRAGRFYHGYGKNTGKMWRNYLSVLEASRSVPGAERVIEQAALATFANFERYLAQGHCPFASRVPD
jgi:heme oxygenase